MGVFLKPERSCSLDGCDRPHRAKGLCMYHYQREWETGDPLTPDRRKCTPGCTCGRHNKVKQPPKIFTKEERRESKLRRFHGITTAEYNAMLADQGGGCKICGVIPKPGERFFPVDHDHSCCPGNRHCRDCIRGILCQACNILVGFVEHNRHKQALDYIRSSKRVVKLRKQGLSYSKIGEATGL